MGCWTRALLGCARTVTQNISKLFARHYTLTVAHGMRWLTRENLSALTCIWRSATRTIWQGRGGRRTHVEIVIILIILTMVLAASIGSTVKYLGVCYVARPGRVTTS